MNIDGLRKLVVEAVAGTRWDNDRIRIERSDFGIEITVSEPHATEAGRWVMLPLAVPLTIDKFSDGKAAIAIKKAIAGLTRK